MGPKSFLSVGPTLRYSHRNVLWCWLGAIVAYSLCCLFWSKIMTGSFFSFRWELVTNIELWRIGRFVIEPVSIFEYPWQILVLGLLMGIIAYAPILIAQLRSFSHSIPFVLAVFLLAGLPGFSLAVLISCLAAASRPLRFRSRFIAIALCVSPQFIYWAIFGGAQGVEPIKWGFSFAPWISAWLNGLIISGIVLGIGHLTRYRPGLVFGACSLVLVATVLLFESTVGFDELDYQLWVAGNNPREVTEFHDHSIKQALDETIMNEGVRRYLAGFFYPTDDQIALRVRLKEKIKSQLRLDRWPSWLILPPELNYQQKRQQLDSQYDRFIASRPKSRRMHIALYYKAILSEFSPNIERLGSTEVLHFYSDYPFERSRQLWYRLYLEFPNSAESIEARWRIAWHWASAEMFEQAQTMLTEADAMVEQKLNQLASEQPANETLSDIFVPPAESALTVFDLEQLQYQINNLLELLSPENRGEDKAAYARLAEFVLINPYSENYNNNLDRLLSQMDPNDPLRDNVLLEKIRLIADEKLRAKEYSNLSKQYEGTDGGIAAFYDLVRLKISFWRQYEQEDGAGKNELLADARQALSDFIRIYPDNFRTRLAEETLSKLPAAAQSQ